MTKHSDTFNGAVLIMTGIVVMLLMIIEGLALGNNSMVGFVFVAIIMIIGFNMIWDDL